jgi:hypothetical protein
MKMKNRFMKLLSTAAICLGITVFSVAPAFADTTPEAASEQLVDSLNTLNLDHVEYLYAYLQSVNLSDKEYNRIADNTERANQIINNTNNVENLPNPTKVEFLRMFMENLRLMQLKATPIDDYGKKVNLLKYEPGTTGLKIQLKDLKGNILATLDPTLDDLSPDAMSDKINALMAAVDALKIMSDTGTFIPMQSAALPNTATDLPVMMALGGLLILMGGAAIVPAVIVSRKSNKVKEA